ncbi:FxDxF family PEP-CTERM protein [Pseudoduganella chitinolytica]|uniref:FxDxF family PEP-CTERM protein n=1 Tax=Pseudoduganella chitinolytica TaxID=34070 RepID=A0ABY8BDP8_9BURK|nr:FxDxF family PEP-CTERM protein [Pseudoduganella chitinolytica]WEF32469.1 FxDxF family PEP-CTERM protein [Pseudoduganella chitinolytica]
MKLSTIALAAALLACTGAQADDITANVNLAGDAWPNLTGAFGITHYEGGTFQDTITFSPTYGEWLVDASLITIGFNADTDIDFTYAAINGHAMSLSPTGVYEFAYMLQEPIPGPLILTVYGTVDTASWAASASYAGTINISPVPEPATYGMLIGGLGILAFLARRRS